MSSILASRPLARLNASFASNYGSRRVTTSLLRDPSTVNSASVIIGPIFKQSSQYSLPIIVSSKKAMSIATSFPKNHPFAFNLMLATSKTCAADIVVQTCVEQKPFKDIDWKRNGIFVVFGFVYLGGFQWYLLIHKFRQWFPTMEKFGKLSLAQKIQYKEGMKDAVKMVVFDVVIHSPMIYFPSYYTMKESIGGHKWNPIDWMKDGVGKYKQNMNQDLKAMATVTLPSDCLQVVLPLHLRMIVRHFVSFFWTSYVSFSRGAITGEGDYAKSAAVQERGRETKLRA